MNLPSVTCSPAWRKTDEKHGRKFNIIGGRKVINTLKFKNFKDYWARYELVLTTGDALIDPMGMDMVKTDLNSSVENAFDRASEGL